MRDQGSARETAKRVRQGISGVLTYAISQEIADNAPALKMKGVPRPPRKGKQPAITDLATARRVLPDAEASPRTR